MTATATQDRLILFTRFPQPGLTKTRLIPALGPRGAAELQRRMTERVLARVAPLADAGRLVLEVHYEGGTPALMRGWLGDGFELRPQGEGDIGARMARALQEAFATGVRRALVIGSDIPGIHADLVAEGHTALAHHDLVLGPTLDGGYYLIGFDCGSFPRAALRLFTDIAWGGRTVLAETLARAQRMGLRPYLLAELADVDRPEDLRIWNARER